MMMSRVAASDSIAHLLPGSAYYAGHSTLDLAEAMFLVSAR